MQTKLEDVGKMRHQLTERFFTALARRRIDLKSASRLAGCHEKMLGRLRRGESEKLDITYVVAIARALADGDAFMADVTGIAPAPAPAVTKSQPPIEPPTLQMPASADSDWWYPPYGDKLPALPDVATVLRLMYRLPAGIDAIDYGLRSLGGVLRRGAHIEFEAGEVAHKALLSCAKHLRECFGTESMVAVNGQALNMRVAVNYLEELAVDLATRVSAQVYPWNVIRLSIDSIKDETLARVAGESLSNPDHVVDFAMRGGMAGKCALFRVDGENVTSLWAGESLAINRAAVIGRNVLDREDIAYARMVRAHVLEACSEGTVYRELDIPMNGLRAQYRRVAAAGSRFPDGTRLVVTAIEAIRLAPYV